MKNQNKSNWATLLREAVITKDKKPTGEGWETTKSLVEHYKICRSTAHRKINALMNQGRIERFDGTDKGRPMVWYREAKPKR